MTDLAEAHTPPDIRNDQIVELLDSWLTHQRAALDDLDAALRTLKDQHLPDHQTTPACRIRNDQQVLHDGGWWYVRSVQRVDLDTVRMHLTRVGQPDLDLVAGVDDTFTTAELFT